MLDDKNIYANLYKLIINNETNYNLKIISLGII